jgi:hypothetical protein
MKYVKITYTDVNNGLGNRVTLWISGCSHHCKGCHNPETWDFNYGREFNEEVENKLFEILDLPYIKGLTLSGGDPIDSAEDVLELVKEVTRKEGESKKEFLCRILDEGSQKAKILKCADRISNMISLGYVTDPAFIERYCDETEYFLLPMSIQVDFNMYQELINLIMTRRRYLEDGGYFDTRHKPTTSADSTK